MRSMKIGELGALAGVPAATVRYYERRGLIAQASRTASGYRQYGPDAARRLRFIKHAQELGYSLEEIQQMLELRIDDPAACARVEATTREKIRAVQQRLSELRHLEHALQALVGTCEQHDVREPCPIFAVLAEDTTQSAVDARRRVHA
jgi:Hg(II)-responsive transcriptional regulator